MEDKIGLTPEGRIRNAQETFKNAIPKLKRKPINVELMSRRIRKAQDNIINAEYKAVRHYEEIIEMNTGMDYDRYTREKPEDSIPDLRLSVSNEVKRMRQAAGIR